MSSLDKVIESIPEGFYEVFTYVVPSTFVFGGVAVICSRKSVIEVSRYAWPNGDWTDLAFFVAIVFGLLVAGQFLNSACHYLLGRGFWFVWVKRFRDLPKPWKAGLSFDEYERELRNAKNLFAKRAAAANMPKIAAKKIVALNMAFAGLCLALFTIVHCCVWHFGDVHYGTILMVSLGMTFLALLDYRKRMRDEAAYISSLYETWRVPPRRRS